MHAVILAGGLGKRLKPITDYVPKPLVPINNTPILERQIQYLKKFGVRQITVCTGYKTKQIENFLKIKSNFGITINVSVEDSPLGTAGAIKKAAKCIRGKSFLVLNGDVITNINLKTIQKTENTIAGIPLQTQFGTLDITGNKINEFAEKKPIKDIWMNAGVYHLSTSILKKLPTKGDIEKTVFPKLAKQGKLNITKFTDVLWFSIDSHKDIQMCAKTCT